MATTPPPRSARALTPTTPLHGASHDPARRSTRTTTKGKHPSPSASGSPRAKRARPTSSQTLSPPTSPLSPPSDNSPAQAHNPIVDSRPDSDEDPLTLAPTSRKSGFDSHSLPTPHKTPMKRAHRTAAAPSRRLFAGAYVPDNSADDELMPAPKKSRLGKSIASTLESFEDANQVMPGVDVFTDTNDRIPELDDNDDNPFVLKKGKKKSPIKSSATKSSPKRSYGMGKDIDEAVRNNKGMIYTFRGKKIYRPFKEQDANPADTADELTSEGRADRLILKRIGAAASRPLTRSSIKPRLLFPPSPEADSADDLAEAETDIEAEAHIEVSNTEVDGQIEDEIVAAGTPKKHHHHSQQAPLTPPTTIKKGKKRSSPFDLWQRTKTSERGGKRSSSSLAPAADEGGPRVKRSRSAQPATDADEAF